MESPCKLILSLDIGASLSKGITTVSKGEETVTGVIEMDSDVFEIDSQILRKQEYLENTNPESRAWIASCGRKGARKKGTAVAVGTLAKKFNDIKDSQIEGVKYEYAVEKILAAIGVAVERYELILEGIECHVNLLIPSDEREGKEAIEKNLKREIKKFQFGGKIIKAKLVELNCSVEGTGGLFYRIGQQKNPMWVNQAKIAILMMGHRNCSFLTVEQGGYSKRETVRIGYFDILKNIKKASIGQKMSDLEQIIPQIVNDNKQRYFKALIRGERKNNQSDEFKKLENSYDDAHQIYWQQLKQWMEAHIPNHIDEVLILGGVAHKFRSNLEEYLGWTNLYWGDTAVEEIAGLFPERFTTDRILAYRFVDVYGIHKDSCRF